MAETVKLVQPETKKPKDKNYWTLETDQALAKYNASTDLTQREAIYTQHLHYPFSKLVENVFNTFKFPHLGDELRAQQDCQTYLLMKAEQFNCEAGKGFSYFSTIAKHYLIHGNTKRWNEMNRNVELVDGMDEREEGEESIVLAAPEAPKRTTVHVRFAEFVLSRLHEFKDSDKRNVQIVAQLLARAHDLDMHNKKAFYYILKKLTGMQQTLKIQKLLKKIAVYYVKFRTNNEFYS